MSAVNLSNRQLDRLIEATASKYPRLHGAALVNKVIATLDKGSKKTRIAAGQIVRVPKSATMIVSSTPRFSTMSEAQRMRVAKLWCDGYTSFEIAHKLGVRGNEKDDRTKPTRGIINQLRSHGYLKAAAKALRQSGRKPVRAN